jgi:hypothetical protein
VPLLSFSSLLILFIPSLTMSALPTRQNQWFQPGEGIAREVITADIQRYLGNDALVRPGEGTGDYEVCLLPHSRPA